MCTIMAADESTLEKTNASSSGTPQQSRDERQRHGSGASDRDQRTVAKKDYNYHFTGTQECTMV